MMSNFRARIALRPGHVRVVALAVCVLCGMSACGRGQAGAQEAKPSTPTSVALAPVVTRPAERTLEVTGTLYGEEEVTVSAEVPGRVVSVEADLGDVVEHGKPLAKIDPTDYALEVNEARASLLAALAKLGLQDAPRGDVDLERLPVVERAAAQAANAAARLDRARKLYEREPPLISEQDFADIQTQNEIARTELESERLNAGSLVAQARVEQSALERAEQRLRDAIVIAPPEKPLRYRIASRLVSVGEVVADGDPLFRLVASDRVKFKGQVPERYSPRIAPGASAELFIEGFDEPFAAAVARIAPAVDIATRSFEIEIDAPNPDGKLKPGGFVRARVRTESSENVRVVPETAIVQFAGVFRVLSVRDSAVAEHRVRLGERYVEGIEIIGLPAEVGQVIVNPPRGLAKDAKVIVASERS